jgi:nucleolysin TIA-1/TIAR
MAESGPGINSQLPPQATAGAPGYDGAQNGSANPSHLPPPPLHIPPNTNPIPTAITSPMSGVDKVMSPGSGGGFRRAAPEPNKRALYVGGLDQRVTEEVLRQIFETTGHVQNVKIIPDKNARGYNYGFVEYDDPGAAERAMQTLNGRRVHQSEIRVNWAYQSNTTSKEDTSNHFHIFVGDLSNEVNDEVLLQAFSVFGSVSEARVMWDMKTGRSRGYGFVAFRDRPDAEKALSSMDGEWLGARAIRCNWANQKGQPSISQQQAMQAMGMTPTTPFGNQHHQFPSQGMANYDMVIGQTPQWQTTCYVGNLTPYTTPNDVVPLFANFGYVVESRFQADRGFAFIKMNSHEAAALAICQMNGYNVNGRPLKCSVSLAHVSSHACEEVWLTLYRSGARTRRRATKVLIHLSRRTAHRAPKVLATRALLQHTFPSTDPAASLEANTATSGIHLPSPQEGTVGSTWDTAGLTVPAAMGVVSRAQTHNGSSIRPAATTIMGSAVAIRASLPGAP